MYFHCFVIISPWKWVGPFIWTKLNPLHQRMLCAKSGWNWLSGSKEEYFLISSMYFCYFVIISPWKRVGPFIWTKLNPLHPRILCAKFGWNWPCGSGEEDFLISSIYFRYIIIISPRKRARPFIWKTWIPFTQGYFVRSLVEIGPVVLGKKMKMWKVNRRTDRQTKRWLEKLTWAFSSGELKKKIDSWVASEILSHLKGALSIFLNFIVPIKGAFQLHTSKFNVKVLLECIS